MLLLLVPNVTMPSLLVGPVYIIKPGMVTNTVDSLVVQEQCEVPANLILDTSAHIKREFELDHLEVTIDGVTEIARAGKIAIVPPNARHSVKALTDGRAIIVDYPLRPEFG